jgi:Tol biopolymer transport system component
MEHELVTEPARCLALQAHLQDLLTSVHFANSPRSSRLLKFLIEEVVTGSPGQLKESLIGVQVFDRDPDYDPKADPIVRVQMRRLRQRLAEYYQDAPAGGAVFIEIPVGSYIPLVHWTGEEDPPVATEPARAKAGAVVEEDVSRTGLSAPPAGPRQGVRRRVWAILLATAGLLAGVVTGYVWMREHRPRTAGAAISAPMFTPISSTNQLESTPAISPDGQRVAYMHRMPDGRKRLALWSGIEAGPLLIGDPSASYSRPTWSPDGTRLAYFREAPNGGQDLVIREMVTGAERLAARQSAAQRGLGLAWTESGEGGYLVTSECAFADTPCSLVAISVADGRRKRLSFPPPGAEGDSLPAVSPDGRWIAYPRYLTPMQSELWIMPFPAGLMGEGGDERLQDALLRARLVAGAPNAISGVAWESQGRDLYVTAGRMDDDSALWRYRTGGSRWERLTPPGLIAVQPASASRAGRLAVVLRDYTPNIWRFPAASTAEPVEVLASTRLDSNPALSPDGQWIVFRSNRTGTDELWIAGRDGSHLRRLTWLNKPVVSSPSWSPDGQHVAFQIVDGPGAGIYVVPWRGGEPRAVVSGQGNDILPRWSKDSGSLYFASNRSGSWQVWSVAVGGGIAHQVTRDGGFASMESPDGQWLYVSKAPPQSGLYRIPIVDGKPRWEGAESLNIPLASHMWGNWHVTVKGVYYVDNQGQGATVRLHDLKTRRNLLVRQLDDFAVGSDAGLAATSDGMELYLAKLDRNRSNIYTFPSLP